MSTTYHADVFDHKSQLAVKLQSRDWKMLRGYIDDELPDKTPKKGFTIVVYVKD